MRRFFDKQGRQRVLVVDSDRMTAEVVAAQVAHSAQGCEVEQACSGFEGLQKIENQMVNIVLAAEKLVDMTGATFINIVQGLAKSEKKKPACVLMAEKGRYVHAPDIDCTAAFDVIKRPMDEEALAYALDRAMDLDGIHQKIAFNLIVGRVLWALIPVALVVGMVIGLV